MFCIKIQGFDVKNTAGNPSIVSIFIVTNMAVDILTS